MKLTPYISFMFAKLQELTAGRHSKRALRDSLNISEAWISHRAALQTMTEKLMSDVRVDLEAGDSETALLRIKTYPAGYKDIYKRITGKDYQGNY